MPKKIMVVDDSNAIRLALKSFLISEGYEVVEAANGMDALTMMKEYSIGLFISDINMPGMDGITLLKNIKEDKNYKHTPVIMLTTENSMDLIDEAKRLGARAWMIKPLQSEQLLVAVKSLFVA